jgi:FAD synthase
VHAQVSGVVVGEGFRFGYKAAGDTQALLSLGQQYGLHVSVIDLVAASGAEKARCAGLTL